MQIEPTSFHEKPPAKPRTALQREASRKNGSRSKGPKTPEGKACSSRNARRHGLNVPAMADPAFRERIREFAYALAGANAEPAALVLAVVVTAAQIDVQRARHAACAVMSAMTPDSSVAYDKALHRLDWIKRYEQRRAVCRDKAMRQLSEWLVAARQQAQNCETNPTRPHGDERHRGESVHATTRSKNGGHCDWSMSNPQKRTRDSASSDETNLMADKTAAVRAELSWPCNRARAGMTKRTRGTPTSAWRVARPGRKSADRIDSCKTNPNSRVRIGSGARHYRRAAVPDIARGYRSRSPPGSNRVFRLLH